MKNLFLVLFLVAITLGGYSQDTFQWRGPNRDGVYPAKNLLKQWPAEGPKMLWHFDELGEGFTSAVPLKDKVIITGMIDSTGYIYAFNHDGKLLWKTNYGLEWSSRYPGVRSTPNYQYGKLYLMSGRGVVLCIDEKDGKILWKKELFKDFDGKQITFGITENLLIMDDMLICTPGGKNNNIVALNKNNGKLIWSSPAAGEETAYCSPAIIEHNEQMQIISLTSGSLFGIDAKTGNMLWRVDHKAKYFDFANTPLYKDGYLFQSNMHALMLKLSDDGKSVTEVWRDSTFTNFMGGYVLKDGYIYGAAGKKTGWECLEWKTGKKMYKSKEIAHGAVVMAEDMLYCYSEKGEVALVKPTPNKFELVSKFKVPYGDKQHWAHPVIDDGRMYIRHGNSLMVYSVAK